VTQPGKVSVTTTFASDEANGVSGRSTVKTSGLDGMMQAFKTCTDAIIDNLALIQRDDGAILDGTVRTWTLGSDVLALIASGSFTIRGGWVTATAYVLGDVVLQSGTVYICMIAHTAGTFAADLAAGRWGAITNTPTASTTSFSPTSTIASSNVQAAIQELDNEVRPVQTILVRELFNGL
jgi:hypothetical protein